jgi:hypothetical protein
MLQQNETSIIFFIVEKILFSLDQILIVRLEKNDAYLVPPEFAYTGGD